MLIDGHLCEGKPARPPRPIDGLDWRDYLLEVPVVRVEIKLYQLKGSSGFEGPCNFVDERWEVLYLVNGDRRISRE